MRTQINSQLKQTERCLKDPIYAIRNYLDPTIDDDTLLEVDKLIPSSNNVVYMKNNSIMAIYMYIIYRFIFRPPTTILYCTEDREHSLFTKDIFERGVRMTKVSVQQIFYKNTQTELISESGSKFKTIWTKHQLCGENPDIIIISKELFDLSYNMYLPTIMTKHDGKVIVTEMDNG